MGWDHVQRDMFVRGFIVGHREGYRRACGTAVNVMNPIDTLAENPFGRCMSGGQVFRKEMSYYENFLTEFYTKYPEDRDVPIRILIEDSEAKTAEQVHEWVKKIGQ